MRSELEVVGELIAHSRVQNSGILPLKKLDDLRESFTFTGGGDPTKACMCCKRPF
jgi:hypothetical protein